MRGVLILANHMAWPMFQQQLSARLDLPVGSYQVMLACSRASDPDQVQKIPVHEGTVRRSAYCAPCHALHMLSSLLLQVDAEHDTWGFQILHVVILVSLTPGMT